MCQITWGLTGLETDKGDLCTAVGKYRNNRPKVPITW